jgi:hypothetical protein
MEPVFSFSYENNKVIPPSPNGINISHLAYGYSETINRAS